MATNKDTQLIFEAYKNKKIVNLFSPENTFWNIVETANDRNDVFKKFTDLKKSNPELAQQTFEFYQKLCYQLIDLSSSHNDGDQYTSWSTPFGGKKHYNQVLTILKSKPGKISLGYGEFHDDSPFGSGEDLYYDIAQIIEGTGEDEE